MNAMLRPRRMRLPRQFGRNSVPQVPEAPWPPSPLAARSRNCYRQHYERVALRQPHTRLNLTKNRYFSWFLKHKKISIARHKCCDVYCGARETVGGSSVSSGCWGEDSNHENGWALRPPRCSAHSIFHHLFLIHSTTRDLTKNHVSA